MYLFMISLSWYFILYVIAWDKTINEWKRTKRWYETFSWWRRLCDGKGLFPVLFQFIFLWETLQEKGKFCFERYFLFVSFLSVCYWERKRMVGHSVVVFQFVFYVFMRKKEQKKNYGFYCIISDLLNIFMLLCKRSGKR